MKTKVVIQRLFSIVFASRFLLFLSIICAIVAVLFHLAGPVLIGQIIDEFMLHFALSQAGVAILLLAVLYLGYSIFTWGMMFTSNKIAFTSSNSIRRLLYKKMEKLPISFFDTNAHGDIISRYINDVDIISDGLLQGISTMISGVITIVCSIIIMLYLNWQMSIVVILSAPFTYLVAKTITKKSQTYFREQAETLGILNGYSEEMLSQIKTVKAFHYEGRVIDTFRDTNQTLYTSGVKSQFYGSLANPSTRFVTNVAYAFVGMAGSLLALSGHITIGSISVFLIYSNVFSKPFNEITGVITQLQSAIASARRVFQILDMEEEHDVQNSTSLSHVDGTVDFQDVCFAYNPSQPLIQHANLHIPSGSKVAIVGKTGAGKTTIVNLLMRFYDIQEGSICIDGNDIHTYTKDALRTYFGMVLQDTYLFEDSIAANIAYGKKNASREEIIEASKKTGAHEFIRHLRHGYDTILSANSSSLSQGQRQLLSITRVLLMNPAILILDEATSSIDTRSERHVNQAMELLMEGKTSFVIAHRLSTIIHSDIILVMEQGNIVEQGTHEQLLKNNGYYTALYQSQFT